LNKSVLRVSNKLIKQHLNAALLLLLLLLNVYYLQQLK
jgi:hypothetical protein